MYAYKESKGAAFLKLGLVYRRIGAEVNLKYNFKDLERYLWPVKWIIRPLRKRNGLAIRRTSNIFPINLKMAPRRLNERRLLVNQLVRLLE